MSSEGKFSKRQVIVDNNTASKSNVVNIENRAGAVLPDTGSMGTMSFSAMGVSDGYPGFDLDEPQKEG